MNYFTYHREFTNPFPAKFVIDQDNFYTENSNKPHHHGIINPTNCSPCPKNPAIARVFREIGRADELGSGIRKLFKYCKAFCGNDPELIEGDVFQFKLPLGIKATAEDTREATVQDTGEATAQADRTANILRFCQEAKSTAEMMAFLGLTHREHFRTEILIPLIQNGLLHPTMPDKPKSPAQKYYSIEKGSFAKTQGLRKEDLKPA